MRIFFVLWTDKNFLATWWRLFSIGLSTEKCLSSSIYCLSSKGILGRYRIFLVKARSVLMPRQVCYFHSIYWEFDSYFIPDGNKKLWGLAKFCIWTERFFIAHYRWCRVIFCIFLKLNFAVIFYVLKNLRNITHLIKERFRVSKKINDNLLRPYNEDVWLRNIDRSSEKSWSESFSAWKN